MSSSSKNIYCASTIYLHSASHWRCSNEQNGRGPYLHRAYDLEEKQIVNNHSNNYAIAIAVSTVKEMYRVIWVHRLERILNGSFTFLHNFQTDWSPFVLDYLFKGSSHSKQHWKIASPLRAKHKDAYCPYKKLGLPKLKVSLLSCTLLCVWLPSGAICVVPWDMGMRETNANTLMLLMFDVPWVITSFAFESGVLCFLLASMKL